MIIKKQLTAVLLPAVLGLSIGLTACGGSGSSNGSGGANGDTGGGNPDVGFTGVSGPLDALQDPISNDVLGQLSSAAAGTPLEGVIDCLDKAVVIDLLDVLDSVLVGVQASTVGLDPTTAFDGVATHMQDAINAFATDLPAVLTSLAGGTCTGEGTDISDSGNPLAGTPLEALGTALAPVLSQVPGADGQDADLTTLATFVTQLNTAFQEGMALVPAEAKEAPVVGGVLATLANLTNNLDGTMQQVGQYNGEGSALGAAITVNVLLNDLLTQVVPLEFIETSAGQGPIISGQIKPVIDQITNDLLLQAVDPATTLALEQGLDSALAPLLDPIENAVLPAILGPLSDALAGGTGTGATPTGTPLDALLDPIMSALSGGGEVGLSNTPLDIILGPLAALVAPEDLTACPVIDTPLAPLCDIAAGLEFGFGLEDVLTILGLDDLFEGLLPI